MKILPLSEELTFVPVRSNSAGLRIVPNLARALALAVFVAATAPAQLEPGWAVYTRGHNAVNETAAAIPGGLVIYHPYLGQNATVTGLPGALTGDYDPTAPAGANAVLVRDDDGSLLVSALYSGIAAEIFDITLDGTAATVRRTYPIGGPVPFSSIDQMAWLSGNRALFSYNGVDRSGFGPTGLAVLDLTTGSVTPVPIQEFPSGRIINSLAVDRTMTTVYFGTFAGGGGIFSVPLTGGSATAVPGWETSPSAIQQLAVDRDGNLVVGPGSFFSAVLRIDPATGHTETVADLSGDGPVAINGLALDPVTGGILGARINAGLGISAQFLVETDGNPIEVPGMDGFESPTGIAVRASLIPFGANAPASEQQWQIRPNPGGAPRLGNADFSLTTTSPVRSHGVLLLSLDRLGTSVDTRLVSNLLIDPTAGAQAFFLVPPATAFTVPLPVPASVSLTQRDLYAQVFTLSKAPPPFAGSQGLWIHIYD